jgi:hypothetical protein
VKDVGGLEPEEVKKCGERGIGEKARARGGKEWKRSGGRRWNFFDAVLYLLKRHSFCTRATRTVLFSNLDCK